VSLVTSQTRMRTLIGHTAGQRLTYKPLIAGDERVADCP